MDIRNDIWKKKRLGDNKKIITSGMFEKLARNPYIKAKLSISQPDFQIIFENTTDNANEVPFQIFMVVILRLYEDKVRPTLPISFDDFVTNVNK